MGVTNFLMLLCDARNDGFTGLVAIRICGLGFGLGVALCGTSCCCFGSVDDDVVGFTGAFVPEVGLTAIRLVVRGCTFGFDTWVGVDGAVDAVDLRDTNDDGFNGLDETQLGCFDLVGVDDSTQLFRLFLLRRPYGLAGVEMLPSSSSLVRLI